MGEDEDVPASGIDVGAIDAYIDAMMPVWTDELRDLCAIPSEEGDLDARRAAADWTRDRLARLGATVDVATLPDVAPLVVGTIGTGRTLLTVQHYDVQPAAPLERWTSPPYDPEVRDGRLYARGACDNKGEFLARVWGIEAYLAVVGSLPCRVRFIVEGEEEHGSPNLDRLLDLIPDIRRADGALSEAGGVDPDGRPEIDGGGRGMLVVDLRARTIDYDAHSSLAMLLPNAAVRLAQALASFWRPDGLPAIDLGAGVTPPTAAQLAVLDATSVASIEALGPEFGVESLLAGRSGRDALLAMTFEPTFNLQSVWSGHTGPLGKTIIPAEANARIDIRLVPDQDPDEILAIVRRHLDGGGFDDVEIVSSTSMRAYWTAPDDPIHGAAARASSAVFGKPTVRYVASPGTIPMYPICARYQVPQTAIGAAHPDCRAHAPDENYRLDMAAAAARCMSRFVDEFAALRA